MVFTKQVLGKKGRILTLEVAKGVRPSIAATEKAGYAVAYPPMPENVKRELQNIGPNVLWQREQMAKTVLDTWQAIIAKQSELSPEALKWSDLLKATELMAKYAGMFEPENPHTTINNIVVDARPMDEKALLQRLDMLRRERSKVIEANTDNASA